MTRYFAQNTPRAGLEHMMMSVPGFQKRGGGMMILSRFCYKPEDVDCRYCLHYRRRSCQVRTCPYIAERLKSGAIEYLDLILEYFGHIPHAGLHKRIQAVEHWSGPDQAVLHTVSVHLRSRFADRVWDDAPPGYLAALYLLASKERLWQPALSALSHDSIDFSCIVSKPHGFAIQDYQEAGYKVLNRTDDASIEALIARMKAEGREKEIQKELKKLKNLKQTNIPKALAYVSGELFEQYIHDMKIVQHFAMLNRQAMMDEIVKGMKLHVEEQFTTIHNYIDTDAMILRKGAVSAKEGERLLIPINMRDGSLLCVGKGNEDWNCSAPHGAGRLMSRADAKQSFTVSEFKKQMAEVYTTSVSKATLDECPMAYKGMQDILDNIGPTADVVKIIRPIYNFKAGDED